MVETEIKLMKRSTSGFTLLELLVVVGILAALVALALPFYQDYVNQSKLTAAEADLQTYKKALAMYDQLETSAFSVSNDLTPLIGKYLQDFRLSSAQKLPMDPWSSDYRYDVAAGSIWSCGPDGIDDVTAGREVPAGKDDVLVTWKPDFFVSNARKANSKTLEVTFSRKVDATTITTGNFTTPPTGAGACSAVIKISATTYRYVFPNNLPAAGSFVLVGTIAAQDGRLLSASKKPDGTAATTAVAF